MPPKWNYETLTSLKITKVKCHEEEEEKRKQRIGSHNELPNDYHDTLHLFLLLCEILHPNIIFLEITNYYQSYGPYYISFKNPMMQPRQSQLFMPVSVTPQNRGSVDNPSTRGILVNVG